MGRKHFKVLVCRGPECGDRWGSAAVYRELVRLVGEGSLDDRVTLDWQACFGACSVGPNVLVREVEPKVSERFTFAPPGNERGRLTALYNRLTPAKAARLIHGHIEGERIQRDLIDSSRRT